MRICLWYFKKKIDIRFKFLLHTCVCVCLCAHFCVHCVLLWIVCKLCLENACEKKQLNFLLLIRLDLCSFTHNIYWFSIFFNMPINYCKFNIVLISFLIPFSWRILENITLTSCLRANRNRLSLKLDFLVIGVGCKNA